MTNFAGCHHPLEAPIDGNNWGTLFLNSYLDYSDLVDGSARTLLVGEFLRADDQLGWASGTRSTLRNTGVPINSTPRGPVAGWDYQAMGDRLAPGWTDESSLKAAIVEGKVRASRLTQPDLPEFVGGFGSEHMGGTQFLLADGAVRFISENIAIGLYQRLGHRADGAMIDEF